MAKGFTLIELLITITVLVILGCMSIPSIQHLIATHQITNDVNQLIRALHQAKLTALMQQKEIYFCPNQDWQTGYMIRDKNNALIFFKGPQKNGSLSYPHQYIKFSSNGFTTGYNGTFIYENFLKKTKHKIIINNTGRVRVSH